MQRIQDPTAAATLPAVPALSGPVGYFTEGVIGVTPPTNVRAWALNMLQEEFLSILTAAGVAPDTTGTDFSQVLASLQVLFVQQRTQTTVLKTTPGAWTFTVPAGVTLVDVPGIRGGGGGGAGSTTAQAGGGGGGGGKCAIWGLTVAPGDTLSGTIGAAGAAGTSGADDATAGGDTTFLHNGVLVATGYGGGRGGWSLTPGGGTGGVAVGGTSNWSGSDGGDGSTNASLWGGNGAPGEDGQGAGRAATSGAGTPAGAPGAGGGAGYHANLSGGNGYPGQVMIRY